MRLGKVYRDQAIRVTVKKYGTVTDKKDGAILRRNCIIYNTFAMVLVSIHALSAN